MMSLASLSAAASAAIPASSTALLVAVTSAVRPPPAGPMGPDAPKCARSALNHPLPNRCRALPGTSQPHPTGPPNTSQPVLALHNPSSGAEAHFRVTRCAGSAGLLLVEPAFRDVLDHAVRHQVPDGLPGRDTLPAVGRGDSEGGDLQQADPFPRQPMSGQPVPGPGAADKVRELEQLIRVLPGH